MHSQTIKSPCSRGIPQFQKLASAAFRTAALSVLALTLFIAGCDSNTSPFSGEPDELALLPSNALVDEGEVFQLRFVDAAAPSREVTGVGATWTVDDPTIASVQDGVVRSLSIGTTTVRAVTTTGKTAEATVEVARVPHTLQLLGAPGFDGVVGETLDQRIRARVVNRYGLPVVGAEVRFRVVTGAGSTSPALATTDDNGVVQARWTLGPLAGPQEVEVEAVSRTTVRSAAAATAVPGPPHEVRLSPASATLSAGVPFRFSSRLVDAYGNRIADVPSEWISSNPDVLDASGDGWVTGLRSGSAELEAVPLNDVPAATVQLLQQVAQAPGQRRGKAFVQIEEVDGESVGVVAISGGDGQSGIVGDRLPESLEIQAADRNGVPLRQMDVHWTVSQGGGQVSQSVTRTNGQGRASVEWTLGTVPGDYTVEARMPDIASATFTAKALVGPVASVEVSPGSSQMEVGDTEQFVAEASDRYGNRITIHPGTNWSAANASVLSVDGSGNVTGRGRGTTEVEAEVEGSIGTASVTVEGVDGDDGNDGNDGNDGDSGDNGNDEDDPEVATVVASESTVAFSALGAEVVLSAEALDADGNLVSGVSFEWTSTDSEVASVTQAGKIMSNAIGTALIIVTATCCEPTSDTVTVTVVQEVASIAVDPASVSFQKGDSRQLAAEARDANGHRINGASFTWSSSDISVVSVTDGGSLKAESEGTANVTASYEGTDGVASVNVEDSGVRTGGTPNRPNEPSGYAPWFSHDFSYFPTDGSTVAASHAGYIHPQSALPNFSVVGAEPGASHGMAHELRVLYPEGHGDGRGPGTWNAMDTDGTRYTSTVLKEWYIHVWVRVEGPDFEMPPNELKLIYLGRGNHDQNNQGGVYRWRTGLISCDGSPCVRDTFQDLRQTLTSKKPGESSRSHVKDFPGPAVGVWVQYEVAVIESAPDQANGRIRMWRDGDLLLDEQNVQTRSSDNWSLGLYRLHVASIYGGKCSSGCPKTRDDYVRWAGLYVSGIPQE